MINMDHPKIIFRATVTITRGQESVVVVTQSDFVKETCFIVFLRIKKFGSPIMDWVCLYFATSCLRLGLLLRIVAQYHARSLRSFFWDKIA